MRRDISILLITCIALLIPLTIAAPTQPEAKDDKEKAHASAQGVLKEDAVVSQLEGLKNKLTNEVAIVTASGKPIIQAEESSENIPVPQELKEQPTKKHSKSMEFVLPKQDMEDGSQMSNSLKEELERRFAFHKQMDVLRNYSPLDLALYIIRTGDQEGVSMVIQELLAEGLITTDEAREVLHKIRETLRYYSERGVERDSLGEYEKRNQSPLSLANIPALSLADLSSDSLLSSPDTDYDSISDRLTEPRPTTEESLEEIIYQLAKLLFLHAAEREGDVGPESSLREISLILAKEVERGAISVEWEKRVLEIVIGSLVDSFNYPDYPVDSRLPGKPKYSPLPSSSLIRKEEKMLRNHLPFSKLTVKREIKNSNH